MQILKEIYVQKKSIRRIKNYLMSLDEEEAIKAKADRYCEGNVSAWVRYASINHVPKREDLIQIERQKKN